MPRDIDSATLAALSSQNIICAFFAEITFRSKTEYVWTGLGDYLWNGQTWTGLGSLASIGSFTETLETQATGLALTLSAIDNEILGESLADLQNGAPATVYFALLNPDLSIIGMPITLFGGLVDKSSVSIGTNTSTITLSLETNLIRLQQGQLLRYCRADQRRLYPGDSFFDRVETLNDQALIWQAS